MSCVSVRGDLVVRRELIEDEVTQGGRVGGHHVEQEVVGAGQEIDAAHLRQHPDAVGEGPQLITRPRLQRTAMTACNGRPSAAGSISAWKPRMAPLSRSARTRARQVEGAIPTAAARALFGILASAASAIRSALSMSSIRRVGLLEAAEAGSGDDRAACDGPAAEVTAPVPRRADGRTTCVGCTFPSSPIEFSDCIPALYRIFHGSLPLWDQ